MIRAGATPSRSTPVGQFVTICTRLPQGASVLPAGKYLVTDDREVTTVLTVHPRTKNGNQRWELADGATLYDGMQLVEAAKLAPNQNHELALAYEKEKQKGNANRATLAVARKMVAWLLAVVRRQRGFVPLEDYKSVAA